MLLFKQKDTGELKAEFLHHMGQAEQLFRNNSKYTRSPQYHSRLHLRNSPKHKPSFQASIKKSQALSKLVYY